MQHQKAQVFLEMKDEIEEQKSIIEQLNDRIIVQDHELQQLRPLKVTLKGIKSMEVQLDEKEQKIAELKKKVVVQEEAIASWIGDMEDKKKVIKD